MMRSLRTRLLTGVIGSMVLLLGILSLLLYVLIARTLINQFDASLISTAEILAGSIECDGDQIEMEVAIHQMPEFQSLGQPTYCYELWRPDGTVVEKSPSLGLRDLPRISSSRRVSPFAIPQDGTSPPQRATSLTFVPRPADHEGETDAPPPMEAEAFTLAVARDASGLRVQLRSLRWLLTIASAAGISLSVIIGTIVVRRGLHPLHLIATDIAAIKVDNLTARIRTEQVPLEVIPVKDRLNELLSRIEASFNRERQFNADVAHELRTPLAGIRSTIEVTLLYMRNPPDYQAALGDCLEIAKGMESVVGRLLMLTRLDSRQIAFRTEEVWLAELVRDCWRPLAYKAGERKIVLGCDIADDMVFPSDREFLSIVLSNLLDNAVEYADEGGHIQTTARQMPQAVELSISNSGCLLTNEQASHVFDCFWRGDCSRRETGNHCGLGLALVQRITQALGGKAVAKVHQGGMFTVQLILPVGT